MDDKDQKGQKQLVNKADRLASCQSKFNAWTTQHAAELKTGEWLAFVQDKDDPLHPPAASKSEAIKGVRQLHYCAQYGLVETTPTTAATAAATSSTITLPFRYFPSIDHGSKDGKREFKGADNRKWCVTEKIDGSNFSFRVNADKSVTFYCRSSERKYDEKEPNGLFRKAMDMIRYKSASLSTKYVYHAEAVSDLRHSSTTYERTPKLFCIVFDVQDDATGRWLPYIEMKAECDRAGLEAVPCLHQNDDDTVNPFAYCTTLVQQIQDGKLVSCLGGTPEGVVLKHPAYEKAGGSTSACKLKFVTTVFKERQAVKKPRATRVSPTDYLKWIGSQFDVPARFRKARQHLQQLGLPDTELFKELDADLLKEYKEELETYIWTHFSARLIPQMKKEGKSFDHETDPVIPRLLAFAPDYFREAIVAHFLPDVCKAARQSLSQS